MFTGLIQHIGRVDRIDVHPAGRRLVIDPLGWSHVPGIGDSISVNGVCLTVVRDAQGKGVLAFDVLHETLRCSTIGELIPDARVNLEHAVRASTLLGGHTVQGHIDCLARVRSITPEGGGDADGGGGGVRMAFDLLDEPGKKIRAVIPKGSIAVDGVSLTIAGVSPQERTFEVVLIPATLEGTTLGRVSAGETVNIETDIIARTIAYQLENYLRASSLR